MNISVLRTELVTGPLAAALTSLIAAGDDDALLSRRRVDLLPSSLTTPNPHET